MHTRLTEHLQEQTILHDSQYGFRRGHSCEHALLEAQNKLTLALDRKQIALLLLIDFSKAFDMVDHDILLQKLEHYGIRGTNLKWFASYLSNRQQYVHINNVSSGKRLLKYSVPQGSILGPVLFIIYINDLPEISKLAKFIFFADDANIILTGTDVLELQAHATLLLSSLEMWVEKHGLKLNIKKTKYMVFTNKTINLDLISLSLNGRPIKISENERFLGVILDSKITWKIHISKLAGKVSHNAGILYKLKGLVPNNILKLVYNSLIQSHLNYCSSVWGLGSKASLNQIFVAQKKAIRAIENGFVNYFYDKKTGKMPSHTKHIFYKNKILTIHNIVAKNCLIAMQRIYRNSYPTKVMSICQLYVQNRNRRQQKYFTPATFRLKKSDSSLPYAGAKLYNYTCNMINMNLQNGEIKIHDKFLDNFKKRITSFLLEKQNTGNENWNECNFLLYKAKNCIYS